MKQLRVRLQVVYNGLFLVALGLSPSTTTYPPCCRLCLKGRWSHDAANPLDAT